MADRNLRVLAEGSVTVVIAGTPVALPDKAASAVGIMNNEIGKTIAVGLKNSVDALATPIVGRALYDGDTTIVQVTLNANEVWVDADTNGTKVSYQILG